MDYYHDITSDVCPLCFSGNNKLYSKDKNRIYFKCNVCELVFVPEHFFLSKEDEKTRYDFHNNSHDDEGYVKFLHRLITPVKERIDTTCCGLDFGSGPIPVLTDLMKQAGYTIDTYDIFYDNKPEVLEKRYDFITMCEVIEHLHKPKTVLDSLFSTLKPHGLLAIMTQPVVAKDRFFGWRYKNDPTHVLFFSDMTFEWIAGTYGCEIENPGYGVYLFRIS